MTHWQGGPKKTALDTRSPLSPQVSGVLKMRSRDVLL